ncbi:hypothetical protein [Novosphingobium colocasiae]|uniref:phage tail fiber protein n=1 Tax=Novosphingobium colocasiae TaxID=1256513 RepID=UPI0035B0B2E5
MNNRTLTSANAILMLSVVPIFAVPQRIQGFSTDDITDMDGIDTAETAMGIDGRLSAGFVPVSIRQNITLQADSESNDLFDIWYTTERAQKEKFVAGGILTIPGTKRQYTLYRGFLRNYAPIPGLRKTAQPRRFTIEWEKIYPQPYL